MQATTLQNLKRAKGVDPDIEKGSSATTINKSEINAARKLKRYITQLTFAKKECEKRLSELGWDVGYQYQDEKVNYHNYNFISIFLYYFSFVVGATVIVYIR